MQLSKMLRLLLLLLILPTLPTIVVAQEERLLSGVTSQLHSFNVDRIGPSLVHPWSIAFLPNQEILISERGGTLYRYHNGTRRRVSGLPDINRIGQGGLLDVEPHPQFVKTNLIFFSFSERNKNRYRTAVARARLVGYTLEDLKIIFRANPLLGGGLHFGSRISFLADGTMLVTLGDRGDRNQAQDLTNSYGAVVRITTDGNVPSDNPFAGHKRWRHEIYSFGHRNPQGLAIDSRGAIYLHEHGPRGGDEINLIEPGKNYGWPRVTFGREYATRAKIGIGTSAPGYVSPLLQWTPSIAPSGMMIYSGKRFPKWQGHLFVGTLVGKYIARVELDSARAVEQEQLLNKEFGRIRDIKEDPNGNIWFITDERRGGLYKISP